MPPTTIEVDSEAADILRRVMQHAQSMGETLGAFLSHALPPDAMEARRSISQKDAWESFVSGMTSWSHSNLPPGYVADDSRESTYDDRS
jgi:hypothetical protein